MALTAEQADLYRQLVDIFDSVMARFTYVSDQLLWNELEHWEATHEIPDEGDLLGDCDLAALANRKQCRAAGIPSRLVFCQVDGVPHLCLEVDGWILCNNQSRVVRRDDLEYQWIALSGYEEGDRWHWIINAPQKPQ